MNKRIFKRCLCGVLTAAMAATALVGFTGCGDSGPGLTVMIYAQSHELEIYEEMRERFEEANPDIGTVDIQQVQQADYATQVTSALAAGNMADVFYVEPAGVARYAELGQILPLDDKFDEAQQEAISDIWPDAINAFRYDTETKQTQSGTLYALPHDYSVFMYAYNKDLFDAKGVAYPDNDSPMTWDEFKDVCAQLVTEDDTNPTWGCAIPTEFFFPQILYGNNGHFLSEDYRTVEMISADGTPQVEFVEAMDFLQELVAEGLAPSPEDDAALAVYQRWISNQIGFYPCGTWDVRSFNNTSNVYFENWGLTYFPVGPHGTYSAARAGTVGYAIYAQSQNVDAAVKFIEYYSTDLEGQRQLSEGLIQAPNLMSYARGEFADAIAEGGTLEYADNSQVLFDYIENDENNIAPNGYGYRNVMPEYVYTPSATWWNGSTGFLSEFTTFLNGGVSSVDYMTAMQPACQEALDTAWSEYEAVIGG